MAPVAENYRYVDEVHPLTVARARYGCHGHPERVPHMAKMQDGWTEDGRRRMVDCLVSFQPVQCGHDGSAADARCDGCRWARLA